MVVRVRITWDRTIVCAPRDGPVNIVKVGFLFLLDAEVSIRNALNLGWKSILL